MYTPRVPRGVRHSSISGRTEVLSLTKTLCPGTCSLSLTSVVYTVGEVRSDTPRRRTIYTGSDYFCRNTPRTDNRQKKYLCSFGFVILLW